MQKAILFTSPHSSRSLFSWLKEKTSAYVNNFIPPLFDMSDLAKETTFTIEDFDVLYKK